MNQYRIVLESGCRIFNSRNLLIEAMKALPSDVRIEKITFDKGGGTISFNSDLLSLEFRDGTLLNLSITESVKLTSIKM